jgi:general secretion pathway protein A
LDHLHHFGLADDPFRNDHSEKYYVEIPSQRGALRRLDRAVRQARGLVCLLGGVGAGKTLLARKLYEDLEEEIFESGMMIVLRENADSEWLLTRFASQLGVEAPAEEREALIGQIYERLAIIREDGRHAVLIVDDAQGLASNETLTEICGLVKLEYEDRRMLSIVLAGTCILERALARNSQLAHHVDARITVPPLSSEETAAYLGQRLQLAGAGAQLLLPGAAAGLHECSGGAPGRLNTLADNALFEAFLEGRKQVARSDVDRAYADLGWGALIPDAGSPAVARVSPVPDRAAPAAGARARSAGAPAQAAPPTPAGRSASAAVADLDSELDAAFVGSDAASHGAGDAGQTVLMDFDAGPAPAQRPTPTRAAAEATVIQLESQDELAPPPKEGDEVDDLFMELLED